jgi:cytochrome c-type biogenesis protein
MRDIFQMLVLPLGLGLLGFVEPCSIGASLLFLQIVAHVSPAARVGYAAVFIVVRTLFIGSLGAMAALIGVQFFGLQRVGWIALGVFYVLLGLAYLSGRAGLLKWSFGPTLERLTGRRGAAALGVLFGLNIPACATPLLLALIGSAAAAGVVAGRLLQGFASLAVFSVALSLPLAAAVIYPPIERVLTKSLHWSSSWVIAIGLVLVVVGLWSLYLGLSVHLTRL